MSGLEGPNEIGRMAAAVDVFRRYLIERDAARAALERANEELESKVEARNAELREIKPQPRGRDRRADPGRRSS